MGKFVLFLIFSMVSSNQDFIPVTPENCHGATICEEVMNYPQDYVDRIVRKLANKGYNWPTKNQLSLGNSFDDKINFPFKDICASRIKLAIPLAARNENGEWDFILNRKTEPLQVFDIELCRNTTVNKACGTELPDVVLKSAMNYESHCRQKHIKRKLISLDKKGKVQERSYLTPSCCNCEVEHVPLNTTTTLNPII